MATTTPNFGWPVPTSTDLVKDGATAIEGLGDAIDASLLDLKGGTSGQILAKNSNTDMDFVWVANDQGDITGITATSPLTGGGTSGAITVGIQSATTAQLGAVQLSDSTSTTSSTLAATSTAVKSAFDLANAAIPKSTVTTNGDVIYATGSSAVTRLGIGTAGQVLTVASGVPSWATPASSGGMTLLSTTSLSGLTTTISSISGAYNDLVIYVKDFFQSNTLAMLMTINGDTTASNYQQFVNRGTGSSNGSYVDNATPGLDATGYGMASSQNDNFSVIYIANYANATTKKVAHSMTGFIQTTSAKAVCNTTCYYAGTTAAITSLGFTANGGTWSAGTVEIYGVK